MARKESRTKTEIWTDKDFIALPALSQRLYWLIYSQQTITLCGVVAYTPTRWASLAMDDTPKRVAVNTAILEERGFVVVDRGTEELLVRSFMRNDNVRPSNPKIWNPAMEQACGVLSHKIRSAIADEIERITKDQEDTLSDGAYDTVCHTLRTRARAASTPTPTPTTTVAPLKATRQKDLVFEAVCEVLGIDWQHDLSPDGSGRGSINKAVQDLKAANATPDEIRKRAKEWPSQFSVTLTAPALAKHWASLKPKALPKRSPWE